MARLIRTLPGLLLVCCLRLVAASDPERQVVERALAQLPACRPRVVVVDRPNSGLLRERLEHAEAFVTHGEPVIYLIRQGPTLQSAIRQQGAFVYALAGIIWHEWAHIQGAGELAAQRKEANLWREFIVRARVDADVGLRYLALVEAQPSREFAFGIPTQSARQNDRR
jgi:hypothetical protein